MKKRDTKESVLLKLDELSRSQHNGKRDSGTQQRPASLNGPIGMIPMAVAVELTVKNTLYS